jgi:FkbM family methyltransferase
MKGFFSISGKRARMALRDILERSFSLLFCVGSKFGPFIRKRRYRGFITYYSRGTVLINMIRPNKIYEETVTNAIISNINKNCSRFFVDVGANIGLITLNVVAEIPNIRVFAFEAGPHQSFLFEQTIEKNRLEDKVHLYKLALGNLSGRASFAIHCTQNACGDGFLDTGRAGEVRFINVMVKTLDEWWKSENFPDVRVIKIDTEGSELLILRGGVEFLHECRPSVFLEIWPANLQPYGISPVEILCWLNEQNYRLETLDGTVITFDNHKRFFGITETFVAQPICI